MARFREIERLRGLAILLAVFNHQPLHALAPTFCGVVGVHLFFVISGFVITLSLLRLQKSHPRPLVTFYKRRFFRLVPMAALSLGVACAASAFFNQTGVWKPARVVLGEAAAVLTLSYNYRVFSSGIDLVYFWSLNVEEHFYLVLPLALLAATRFTPQRVLQFFFAAWLAAGALRVCTAPATYDYFAFWTHHFSTHAQLDVLLAGVLLAAVHHYRVFERPSPSRELRLAGRVVAWSAALGLTVVSCLMNWQSQWGWTLVEALSVVLVWCASFRRDFVLHPPVVSRVFEHLGARAYTIYLLHMPVWNLMLEAFGGPAPLHSRLSEWQVDLAYAALVLAASELAYRGLERPLTALGRRLTSAAEPQPATSAPQAAA